MNNVSSLDPHILNRDNRAEWNLAASRLRLYLREIGIHDELTLTSLETKILLRSMLHHDSNPQGDTPLVITLQQAQQMLASWIADGISTADSSSHRRFCDGLTCLHASGLMSQIPDTFLTGAPDTEARTLLARSVAQACPELSVSNMTARPIDYGPLAQTEPNNRSEWSPVFLGLAFWSGIYVLGYFFFIR